MNRFGVTILILLPIILLFLFISCDQGIEPKPISEPTGFSGEVTFIGDWPIGIQRTHIVVFKNPLLSESDFNVFNLKYVSAEIPNGTQFYTYSTLDSSIVPEEGYLNPGEYSYIAVAQSKSEEVSLNRSDWFVSGLYFSPGDSTKPGKIIITEGTILENIQIVCDFDNPPPQPPGGN
jgi:hypothetical protein